MVKSLAAVAAEPADFRMRLQGVLERAAAAADTEKVPVPGPYVTISREAESGGAEIARRLAAAIRPGGALVVGSHESLPPDKTDFEPWAPHGAIHRRRP